VKLEHVAVRAALVRAVRQRELAAEKVHLKSRRAHADAAAAMATRQSKHESRVGNELASLNRKIALRDLRRDVAKERAHARYAQEAARETAEHKLAGQRAERREGWHRRALTKAEAAATLRFASQQQLVSRHLERGLIAEERAKRQVDVLQRVAAVKAVQAQRQHHVAHVTAVNAERRHASAIAQKHEMRQNLDVR
jgi:hypothetical protein